MTQKQEKAQPRHRREIIFDTETTGIDPWDGNRITEIALVEMIDGELTGNYKHFYLNPERDIPKVVQDLTGLTPEKLKDCPKFADVADELLEFIGDSRLVFHARAGDWDGGFDPGFVNAELMRINRLPLPVDENYNMRRDAELYFLPKGMSSSLNAVCEYFGVTPDKADVQEIFKKFGLDVKAITDRDEGTGHSALLDTVMTAIAYPRLKEKAKGLLVDELSNGGPKRYRPGMEEMDAPMDYKYIGPGQLREMTEDYLCDEFRRALQPKPAPANENKKSNSQARAKKRTLRNRIRLF